MNTSKEIIELAEDRLTDIFVEYFEYMVEYGDKSLSLLDKLDRLSAYLRERKEKDLLIIDSIESRY